MTKFRTGFLKCIVAINKKRPYVYSTTPFTATSSVKQQSYSQGQLIAAMIPTSSTNSWVHRFYYE